jgi:predicted DNA-binding transcriptional regulator YafY
VRLSYRSEAGSERVIEADPWAVVIRHGRWYLLCWSHSAQARRVYRIDRVAEVQLLVAPFDPPLGLDPVAMLEDHLAIGWEYDVEVVIDAPLDTVTRCLPHALGRLEPLDTGGTRLVGSTSNPMWYARALVAIPAPYQIVRCPELREAARVLGQRLLAAASPDP